MLQFDAPTGILSFAKHAIDFTYGAIIGGHLPVLVLLSERGFFQHEGVRRACLDPSFTWPIPILEFLVEKDRPVAQSVLFSMLQAHSPKMPAESKAWLLAHGIIIEVYMLPFDLMPPQGNPRVTGYRRQSPMFEMMPFKGHDNVVDDDA